MPGKDQGTAWDDFTDADSSWELLTNFTADASSSTFAIQQSDDAHVYVIADALRIVRLRSVGFRGLGHRGAHPPLRDG